VNNCPFNKLNMTPEYYEGQEGIDVIDCIKILGLNFNTGNILKYLTRTGKKTPDKLVDLEKAKVYLEREIEYERNRK